MMKTCKYSIKDINAYLTNKMSEDEEVEFQFHLGNCDFCRNEIEQRRKLSEGLSETEAPTFSVQRSYRKLWLSTASIAAVAILGIFLFQRPSETNTAFEQQSLAPIQKNCIDSIPNDSIQTAMPYQK